jgi:integrase
MRDGKPLGDHTMVHTLRRMDKEITAHGFRRSFRTWAGNKPNHPREICEEALAHKIGSQVERSYKREVAIRSAAPSWMIGPHTASPKKATSFQ